jgi:hypothetical protein
MSVIVITVLARDRVATGQSVNASLISPFPKGGRRKAIV